VAGGRAAEVTAVDAPRRQGFVTSLAVVALSMLFVDHRRAGTGLMPLSVAMLVVGGGFGPPVLACWRARLPVERG